MPFVRSRLLALPLGAALAVAGCGSGMSPYGGGGSGCPTGSTVVTVGGGGLPDFSPASVDVKVGETVCWVWATAGYDVTSGSGCAADGAFGTGHTLAAGQIFTVPFYTVGTYPYFSSNQCSAGMTGTVIVGP